jgi:hypothetical protein
MHDTDKSRFAHCWKDFNDWIRNYSLNWTRNVTMNHMPIKWLKSTCILPYKQRFAFQKLNFQNKINKQNGWNYNSLLTQQQ